MEFNFSDFKVEEVKREVVSRAIPRNPVGMRIRLFKNGEVYPSQELVDEFDLEYQRNDYTLQSTDDMVPMAFDIVDSGKWKQTEGLASRYIFITATPKSAAKVDLFGQVGYNADGSPVKSVLNQGSKRSELIDMVREVYDLQVLNYPDYGTVEDELFLDKNYVDLEVRTDVTLPTGTNIFHLPKYIVRGEKAGSITTVRREDSVFHPLVVVRDGE